MNKVSDGFDLRLNANLSSAQIFSAHSLMNEYLNLA
jgi:hypothetical protein